MIINTAMIEDIVGKIFFATYTGTDEQYIAIYQGVQPSQSAFNSAWSTNYFIQKSDNTVGSDVLAIYGPSLQLGSSGNSIYLNTAGTSAYHADGTATWAVILQVPASLESSTDPTTLKYIICDVSNAAGTGIVKVDSTTVSGSAPTLTDVNITLGAA